MLERRVGKGAGAVKALKYLILKGLGRLTSGFGMCTMRCRGYNTMDERRKICPVCNEDKPINAFQLNPDGSIRKHVCKLCYGRKWRAQIKLEMLNTFGRKCQCCGERNPQFLTLDHVNNDGGKQRAKNKEEHNSTNIELIYQQARREGWPKDKYQLLCMNCNFAKGHWGICPHQSALTADAIYVELESRVFPNTGKKHQNMNLEPLKLGPLSRKLPEKERHEHRLETFKKSHIKKQILELLQNMSSEQRDEFLKRTQGP